MDLTAGRLGRWRRITMPPLPRLALLAFGVALSVLPLMLSSVVAVRVPIERVVGDLPRGAPLDYISRFTTGFAPLREGYISQLLGRDPGSAPLLDQSHLGGLRPFTSQDPLAKIPVGSGLRISPNTPGDPSAVQLWRSHSPSVSAGGTIVAYLSTDTRVPGMDPTPCPASPADPTTESIIWKYSRDKVEWSAPCTQVVVQNAVTGNGVIASVGPSGEQANSSVHTFMLSGNGRFVVFATTASNLVPNDDNASTDIFVRDLAEERTELISVSIHGGPIRRDPDLNFSDAGYPVDRDIEDVFASISAETGSISFDGRFVSFESSADDLVAGDTRQSMDVFVRDRLLGTTERVSGTWNGAPPTQSDVQRDNADRLGRFQIESAYPCMSPNGRYVAFRSQVGNLVPNDRHDGPDVFVRDTLTNRTEIVTVSPSGGPQNADAKPAYGVLRTNPLAFALKNCVTSDGRYVVFESGSTNLVANDTNEQVDIFLRDRHTSTTRRVNLKHDGSQAKVSQEVTDWWVATYSPPAAEGAALSPDGRFIAFQSIAKLTDDDPDPRPAPQNPFIGGQDYDLFVYEIATSKLTRLDVRRYAGDYRERVGSPALSWGAMFVVLNTNTGETERLTSGVHLYRWKTS